MPEYLSGNRKITLRPSDAVASGGEADVFKSRGEAFKIFKTPEHVEVKGQAQLENETRARLAEHQQKLPALMALAPRLPPKIIVPEELVRTTAGRVAGYKMRFIDASEVLYRYSERTFREQGAGDDVVRDVFLDLYTTVEQAHRAGFVFGDFNDLNVLVKGREAFVIDADSGQFGAFQSRMFMNTFVDPRICDAGATLPLMVQPHSATTDWYAYLVMLMRSLLYVGPYGGVYRPSGKGMQVPHDARPLKRITVFHPDVRYPKPARPFTVLPDDLLEYFKRTFEGDLRGMPPRALIEDLRFTVCTSCGTAHARGMCPQCFGITPVMRKERITGKLSATKVFETTGVIVFAAMQDGMLRYLYHHDGAYRRDGGRVVVEAPLDPSTRFRIKDKDTMLAKANQSFLCSGTDAHVRTPIAVDAYGTLPLIDANSAHVFYAEGGSLYRSSELGVEYREKIGDVLSSQTLFWVGEELGFGFYRAAELSSYFMFRPAHRGISDVTTLPGLRGQLVDSTCYFGHNRVWFFTVTQEGGKTIHRGFLLDERGALLAKAEGAPDDGTWLGRIRGACAAGDLLLVPTDDGVMRVRQNGGTLGVDKEYPDTAEFVDAGSRLLINKHGLYVVRHHDIWQLVMR